MRYGITLPFEAEPRELVELGCLAEQAGWDGVFVWDGTTWNDPWVVLAAVAVRTERIRLGTMLTPVSRRRPWKLAQEVATLDRLSNGRAILPVALGAPDNGFANFGEETDRRVRAELLDEGLDILDGLWSGQPFSYTGKHYQLRDAVGAPRPVQQPRVPIWVVAAWPRMKSMRRALRCDGMLPVRVDGELTPADVREAIAFVKEQRQATTPFDVIFEGETPGDDPPQAATLVRPWVEAGATWWLENVWNTPRQKGGGAGMRRRIEQGPPRIGQE